MPSFREKLVHKIRSLLFRPYTAAIDVAGTRLEIVVADLFAKDVYDFQRSWPELEWAREHFPLDGGTIIDVGANQGITALFYALNSPSSHVAAIDPLPFNIDCLARNIQLNNATNITIWPYAAGNENTTIIIADEFSNAGRAGERTKSTITVPLIRLDDHFGRDVAYLKIDVEGMEWEVMEGAARLIQDCRPLLEIEAHLFLYADRPRELARLLDYLQSLDYRIRVVKGYQGAFDDYDPARGIPEDFLAHNVLMLLCEPA